MHMNFSLPHQNAMWVLDQQSNPTGEDYFGYDEPLLNVQPNYTVHNLMISENWRILRYAKKIHRVMGRRYELGLHGTALRMNRGFYKENKSTIGNHIYRSEFCHAAVLARAVYSCWSRTIILLLQ